MADFETWTEADYRIYNEVRVYLWHARELYTDREAMGYSIDTFLMWASKGPSEIWFHNLKFDGNYILSALLLNGWEYGEKQEKNRRLYRHIVTDTGQWMELILMYGKHVVHIRDSAKKFPGFSLEEIAKVYHIQGKSYLDVDKVRGPDYVATDEDKERVKGDTRILRVAMEDLMSRGMKKLTMASDAKQFYLDLYEKTHGPKWKREYNHDFPKLSKEIDSFVRRAYKGGYVYVNPKYKALKVFGVSVLDVNSMFPWAMRYMELPFGMPIWRKKPLSGDLYIVQFEAAFKLKPGKVPTVQVKGNFRYVQAEYLTESKEFIELSMTNLDYEVFRDHYESIEQNHKYMCFHKRKGDYNRYIDYWMAKKEEAVKNHDGPGKATAKRFLNSLYGKRGENIERKGKMSYIDDEGIVRWDTIMTESEGDYLPHAVFITSWARWNMWHTIDKVGLDDFIYCDTDSVHLLHADDHLADLDIHPSRLGAWKLESTARMGVYLAPKKYCHLFETNDKGEKNTFTVTCAGMPKGCKDNVRWWNFKLGAEFEGKLSGKTVKGGYCLLEVPFKIRVE